MKSVLISWFVIFFAIGMLLGFFARDLGISHFKKQQEWSIGIYQGSSPFNVTPINPFPVLTKGDVKDRDALFVADPFMIKAKDLWYMFFEVKDGYDYQTDIAYATSKDGLRWKYGKVVLNEQFPQSYPYVFEWQGEYYMLPESYPTNSIRLYKANNFPEEWILESVLIRGKDYVDPSIFRYDNKWWIFASTSQNKDLYLFYSYDLKGPWVEHQTSPVITNNRNIARPGGRIIEYNESLYRVAQDDDPYYGNQVRIFKIDELSEEYYSEHEIEESPIIKAGDNFWSSEGMHQFDVHEIEEGKWMAVVDGYKETIVRQ